MLAHIDEQLPLTHFLTDYNSGAAITLRQSHLFQLGLCLFLLAAYFHGTQDKEQGQVFVYTCA